MLSTSDEIAGRGVMFLYVDDLDAERRRLQGLGIVLGGDIEGDYSTLAQVRDPDGTCSRWRRRARGHLRLHDRAERGKSAVWRLTPACRGRRHALPLMLSVIRQQK